MATDCQGRIKGILMDKSGNSIDGAYIFAIDNITNQKIVAGTYSNDKGEFTLEVPCGNKFIGISRIGYQMVRQEVSIIEGQTSDLGKITLKENVQELQTVIVKGRAIRVKSIADGFSVNVKDIAQSSNNALDLLGRLPLIRVKGNDISVIGKEHVLIKVNNVMQRVSSEQLADVLRGYDASLIESIDVITSPPLKYDSDGTTVMIILHMNSKFSKYIGGNVGTEFMKGAAYNGRYAVYGSGIFNNEKLFIDITPSYNRNFSYMTEKAYYTYDNKDYYINCTPSRGTDNYQGGYATVQYQYCKHGLVGFNGNINKRTTENKFKSEEIVSSEKLFNQNHIDIERPHVNASVYAEHSFSKYFKAWIETSYYNYQETTKQSFEGYDDKHQNPLMSYLSNQNLKTDGLTLSNDYALTLGKESIVNLDFGIKAHYANISNFRSNEFINAGVDSPIQDDRIKVNEVKFTPYFSTTMHPWTNWQFRLGAQFAYSSRKIDGENIDTEDICYTNFLPNFIVSWSPRSGSRLSLNITSGSTDPKFGNINPFVWRINQNSYQRGNLGLKSESNYSYKLIYTYKGNMSVTGYMKQNRNEIKFVGRMVDGAVYYVTENAQNTMEFGIRPSYYFDRLKWMEFSIDAYWGYSVSKGLVPDVVERATSQVWGGNTYASFVFNRQRTLTGYVTCDYTGKQKTAVSTINPMVDFGIGISWYLLDRKLGISLSGLNLFSSPYKGVSRRDGYTINFDNKYNYPTLYMSVTYKFNNIKDATPRRQKMTRTIEQRM